MATVAAVVLSLGRRSNGIAILSVVGLWLLFDRVWFTTSAPV